MEKMHESNGDKDNNISEILPVFFTAGAAIAPNSKKVILSDNEISDVYVKFWSEKSEKTINLKEPIVTVIMGPEGSGKQERIRELNMDSKKGIDVSRANFYPYIKGWAELLLFSPFMAKERIHYAANAVQELSSVAMVQSGHSIFYGEDGSNVKLLQSSLDYINGNLSNKIKPKYRLEIIAAADADAYTALSFNNENAIVEMLEWKQKKIKPAGANLRAPENVVPQKLNKKAYDKSYGKFASSVEELLEKSGHLFESFDVIKQIRGKEKEALGKGFKSVYSGKDGDEILDAIEAHSKQDDSEAGHRERLSKWHDIKVMRKDRKAGELEQWEAQINAHKMRTKLSHFLDNMWVLMGKKKNKDRQRE